MALDEATAAWVAQVRASGARPLAELTPAQAREVARARNARYAAGPPLPRVSDYDIAGPDGPLKVRVLVPGGEVSSVLVLYHGGGWVTGDVDGNDGLARTLASRLQAAVVNVGYRLAPEHRYPVAVQDSWTALAWAHDRAEQIAGRRVPLVVMGDSAGGNLAAVVAQMALAAGGPPVAGQVLVYPVTDFDLDTASYLDPESQLLLTRESMAWYWDQYVPDKASRGQPQASPLRAPGLAGLPPAVVLTAEHDVLRDEGEAYAAALAAAGVPVRQRRFAGQMHGFFGMLGILPGCAEGIDFVAAHYGELLAGAARS